MGVSDLCSSSVSSSIIISELRELKELINQMSLVGEDELLIASEEMISCVKRGGRIFIAGNGGSASQSDHLAAEFVGRFKLERMPYPAQSLASSYAAMTAIANDYSFEEVFSRQLKAHASKGDLVIALTTSGRSPNIIRLLLQAQEIQVRSITLTGIDDKEVRPISNATVSVPSMSTAHIQEAHLFVGHLLALFGELAISGSDNY